LQFQSWTFVHLHIDWVLACLKMKPANIDVPRLHGANP